MMTTPYILTDGNAPGSAPDFIQCPNISRHWALADCVTGLPQYTVATLPPASGMIGDLVLATDSPGGAQPVFSDGISWRQVSDRMAVT